VSLFLRRFLVLIALIMRLFSIETFAQEPLVEEYRVRIVTKEGNRFRGVLDEVTDSQLYVETRPQHWRRRIPLSAVRKVVIRRENKKTVLITGAVIGALIVGFISNESLRQNPARSPVAYGLTLAFASAGGATAGLILSSAIGNVSSRVIRPLDPANPEGSLRRQLEPFSVEYQQDLLNRLPDKTSK
jgi:hypothetical protein